jgi:hypothetical protein
VKIQLFRVFPARKIVGAIYRTIGTNAARGRGGGYRAFSLVRDRLSLLLTRTFIVDAGSDSGIRQT